MKEVKNERLWNPNFLKYTEFIVNHPNYKGLYLKEEVMAM